MALGEQRSTLEFLAEVQRDFLRAVARAGLLGALPADLAASPARLRLALLERQPGFGETLLAHEGAPHAGHSPQARHSRGSGNPLDSRFRGSDESADSPTGEFTAERLGQRYEAFLGRSERQRQGSFYTARPMIRRLLAEPLAHPEPRLLDLAMGCGAFLSEALALRGLADPAARFAFACAALHGVERDPIARELAVLSLWLQIGHLDGDPRRLMANLRVGNSLLAPGQAAADDAPGIDWPRDFMDPMRAGGFTALVGNPPFVNIERLDAAEKARYRAAFPSLQKRFDLFVPMAERALDLTRPGGHLALVLPQAFLTQAYAEPLRRRFLAETTLLRLEASPFPGASVQTVLVSAEKTCAPPDHRIVLVPPPDVAPPREVAPAESGSLDGSPPIESLPQEPLSRLPEARIPLRGGRAFEMALLAFERGIPLGAVAFATWGIRGVPISKFHRSAPDHPSCRPMLKGEGIEPYRATWGGKWLRYEPAHLYRPLFAELFAGEKLVLRKVSGRRGLVAARDREGFLADDSVLCCQLRRQLPADHARRYGGADVPDALAAYDLSILLAFLNSRLGALVFSHLLGNGLNVYPAAVMRMPLPPHDAERFAIVRALVARRELAQMPLAETLDHAIEEQIHAMFGLPDLSCGGLPAGGAI